MDVNRLEHLARLAELRATGALSEGEFEAEKAKLLKDSPRWTIYAGVAVLAAAGAAGLGVWAMRGSVPVDPAARPRPAISLAATPSALPSLATVTRTPAQELDAAFLAATGHQAAYTEVKDGDVVTTEPVRMVDLPFGRALLTSTEIKDGCHACAGHIGVYYLEERNGAISVTRRFAEAVSGWAWGAAPDYEVTNRFTSNPAIFSSGGDMHQGYSEGGATITELTPHGPVTSDLIHTGSDNSGAITEDSTEKTCSVEGTIENIVKDRSFDVAMKGTATYRLRYAKRGGRVVAVDKDAASCA